MTASRLSLLGVRVTAFDLPAAAAEMQAAVAAGERAYACTCPVYTLMQGHERPEVRAALNGARWVTPDGMPVVWALRRLGARDVGRVYGPDLLLALSALAAQHGTPQFYLGGGPGVAETLAANLQQRFPGLAVAGTAAPPYRELSAAEDAALVEQLNASGAAVVWVGLGSPKQDLWMARFRPRLAAPLLVGVGAAFDFFTGRQRQAPRWAQRSGLEWLFRLVSHPGRLWRRYLIYNPKFVWRLGLQLCGLRRYD
ncbi:MAG: WecB/TagA/CpsF family glycosyltransferase [Anaerolineales bacterium]|nr:WecB/TagA/CpsF family glycosyltransferase [Anaerolineales bacterium]